MRGFSWVNVGVFAAGLRAAPTFYEDLLPVVPRNCQWCHRTGEAAPMPLLTSEDARPRANSVDLYRPKRAKAE